MILIYLINFLKASLVFIERVRIVVCYVSVHVRLLKSPRATTVRLLRLMFREFLKVYLV